MKSSTYKKNGKGEKIEVNSKMGENAMKTVAYKRIDGKVQEVSQEDNSLQSLFVKAYKRLTLEIKQSRYTFNQVNLQDAITSILGRLNDIEIEDHSKVYHYLVSACSKREKVDIRQAMSYDLMKDIHCEYFIENSGISETYVNEAISRIKDILSSNEYEVFDLYHIKGHTQKAIADKLDSSQTDIHRKLELIGSKIAELKISYLYENRYIAYQSKSKRRYVRYEDHIEDNGNVGSLPIDQYEPMSFEPISIPANKAMQYPTKQYYKTKRNDFGYVNESQIEYFFTSNLTLGHSKIRSHKGTIEYLEDNSL